MSRGKYLNLEEARKAKQLNQFAKEHQSESNKNALLLIHSTTLWD